MISDQQQLGAFERIGGTDPPAAAAQLRQFLGSNPLTPMLIACSPRLIARAASQAPPDRAKQVVSGAQFDCSKRRALCRRTISSQRKSFSGSGSSKHRAMSKLFA